MSETLTYTREMAKGGIDGVRVLNLQEEARRELERELHASKRINTRRDYAEAMITYAMTLCRDY